MERKDRLIEVFRDTQRFYTMDPTLSAAVAASMAGTRLYEAGVVPANKANMCKAGLITVSQSRTFEAAMRLAKQLPNKKIAILNFASASNPGGGVKSGSSAQEECLCRCSTLYPTLNQHFLWQQYYGVNRASGNVLHTDACIYSPGIVICKTDTDYPTRMREENWCVVDVISCAAPNLRSVPANMYNHENGKPVSILPSELQLLHEQRACQILSVAASNNVDVLVLGAFGCGAFRNDPYVVAKAYHQALERFAHCFDLIEFAIYCRDAETKNYEAFLSIINSGLSSNMFTRHPVKLDHWKHASNRKNNSQTVEGSSTGNAQDSNDSPLREKGITEDDRPRNLEQYHSMTVEQINQAKQFILKENCH